MKQHTALLLLLVLAGCRGAKKDEDGILPFHLGLLPVASQQYVSAQPEDSESVDFELDIKPATTAEFRAALQKELETNQFLRVTSLADPLDGDEDVDWYLEQARAADVDYLLECTVRYSASVNTSLNEKFALNVPLFLVGGPFSWWVNDRKYLIEVSVVGTFYDPNLLAEEAASLGDRQEVLRLDANLDEASLDLIDRTEGSRGSLAYSIFVPPGLLHGKSEGAQQNLIDEIVAALTADLSTRLEGRKTDLVEGRHLKSAEFFVDPLTLEARKQKDGEVVVSGDAYLRQGRDVDELSRYWISPGDRSGDEILAEASWSRDDRVRDDRRSVGAGVVWHYRIESRLKAGSAGAYLQLFLEDSLGNVRSFTLPVGPVGERGA